MANERRAPVAVRRSAVLCYPCIEQHVESPAVALCRNCNAALCLDHLHETAAWFSHSRELRACPHNTWTPVRHAGQAVESIAEGSAAR